MYIECHKSNTQISILSQKIRKCFRISLDRCQLIGIYVAAINTGRKPDKIFVKTGTILEVPLS